MRTAILLANGFVPAIAPGTGSMTDAGTLVATMAGYGYTLSLDSIQTLRQADRTTLAAWWAEVEPVLASLSGADRSMDDFVVYKNFPQEVLDKSDAEYWFAQILMYLGAPNDWFTEAALPRPELRDDLSLRVLHLETPDTLSHIAQDLVARKADWTEDQQAWMQALLGMGALTYVSFDAFGSRSNAARLAASLYATTQIVYNTPMDVLRTAAAFSNGDPGLRMPTRLVSLPRALRRHFLQALEAFSVARLESDFAMRLKAWKPLLHALHAGAAGSNVAQATARARAGVLKTEDARVEAGIKARNREVIALLEQRPGVFARRLHALYGVFGVLAFERFLTPAVLKDLSIGQLLKLEHYFASINDRAQMLVSPRGLMSKSQVLENTKVKVAAQDLDLLCTTLSKTIAARLDATFPQGFNVAPDAFHVGLPVNGQEALVARGTVFDIPASMTFLRSASFWKMASEYGNIWFDNGWTFMDANWTQMGACTWDEHRAEGKGTYAVFSGDPTNSKDHEGRGCQMIDLYLDKLAAAGVAYGVWSILSYNGKPFGEANDVLATLQWGENAETGKLYEPARAQVVLPLVGPDKAKIVAVLDVAKRQLVFLDANLPMIVHSAARNADSLEKRMPALMESVRCAPTVGHLFAKAKVGSIPVVYTDTTPVTGTAYVFKPTHAASAYTPLNLAAVLEQTG